MLARTPGQHNPSGRAVETPTLRGRPRERCPGLALAPVASLPSGCEMWREGTICCACFRHPRLESRSELFLAVSASESLAAVLHLLGARPANGYVSPGHHLVGGHPFVAASADAAVEIALGGARTP